MTPRAGAPGRYTAELSDRWNYWLPSGGALMTVALRAARAELATPEMRPLSATATFCAPLAEGPLEIEVEVLRRGSAASQLRAHMWAAGEREPGLELTAIFGRDREGFDVRDVEPPPAKPPDELPRFHHSRWVPPFSHNFEYRRAIGGEWWREGASAGGPARSGYWYRYRVPQRLPSGELDPFALPPIADTMPGALFQKIGPEARRTVAPSLDLTVHFLEDTRREWVLTYAHARRARAGYATADIELWDDEGRLLAYATQMMILRTRRARRA